MTSAAGQPSAAFRLNPAFDGHALAAEVDVFDVFDVSDVSDEVSQHAGQRRRVFVATRPYAVVRPGGEEPHIHPRGSVRSALHRPALPMIHDPRQG